MRNVWSGFYKKALKERQSQLKLIFPGLFGGEFPFVGLDDERANNMIENCIGTMGLPVGLALNLKMNGQELIVPMAIEEPSVVAAVSGACKTISLSIDSGFVASSHDRNIVYAQVQLLDLTDELMDDAILSLNASKEILMNQANKYCPSMVKRDGGVVDITFRKITRQKPSNGCSFWLVVHIHVDVCDAMGANCASTVAEGLSPYLQSLTGARIGFRIVSNLSTERVSKASFLIPITDLSYKGVPGSLVAERLVESYEWASDDPFRAVTHNKGIMNGIDAVAIATGQDWRAIEAASHAWASIKNTSSQYGPLTRYWTEERDGIDYFGGELELPISVGTCGGVLKTNPVYSHSLGLLGKPDAKQLAQIMVCIGLAQNFAALRALSTEGIQRGHMSLHARNICIAAGAPSHAITECVAYMIESGRINSSAAKEYLEAHELQNKISGLLGDSSIDLNATPKPASMFYFEEAHSDPVTLNIAFQTLGSSLVNIELTPSKHNGSSVIKYLFGSKTFDWIGEAFKYLDKIRYVNQKPLRANRVFSRNLKYLSVLMNVLLRGLFKLYPNEMNTFLVDIFGLTDETSFHLQDPSSGHKLRRSFSGLFHEGVHGSVESIVASASSSEPDKFEALQVGLPLFLALWKVFEYRIMQWVGNPLLADALVEEQRRVFSSFLRITPCFPQSPQSDAIELMKRHAKEFQVTCILLCDAVSFDASYVTLERISFLFALGNSLEWEQSICHDCSPERIERDTPEILNALSSLDTLSGWKCNGYLLWSHFLKPRMVDRQAYQDYVYSQFDKTGDVSVQDLGWLEKGRAFCRAYYS